jgi:hypothetical protein
MVPLGRGLVNLRAFTIHDIEDITPTWARHVTGLLDSFGSRCPDELREAVNAKIVAWSFYCAAKPTLVFKWEDNDFYDSVVVQHGAK